MIGWIILGIVGGLLLLIAIALSLSVRADIEYKGDFTVKVKYLFFTLYDSRKPKSRKKSKKKSKKKVKQKPKNVVAKKSKKQQPPPRSTFAEKVAKESGIDEIAQDIKKANSRSFDFEMLKLIYDSAKTPIKRLISKFRVSKLHLDCTVGGEDAAKTALAYGFQSAAISGFLTWINEVLSLKVKRVNVIADFDQDKTTIYMKCRVKIRVGAAAACLLGYMVNTVRNSSSK